eukprot:s6961_g1.t1
MAAMHFDQGSRRMPLSMISDFTSESSESQSANSRTPAPMMCDMASECSGSGSSRRESERRSGLSSDCEELSDLATKRQRWIALLHEGSHVRHQRCGGQVVQASVVEISRQSDSCVLEYQALDGNGYLQNRRAYIRLSMLAAMQRL